MPAKEQTVSKLTELLRLLEVRIEQRTVVSVNENSIALKASGFNKNLQRPQETHQTKDKFVQYPQRACYVCGSLDHLISNCTDPRQRKQKVFVYIFYRNMKSK